jgi:hypothetical protein
MNLRSCSLLFCSLTLLIAESAAGLKWAPPAGWKAESGARPMRVATYIVPAASGDADSAECAVYFFGEGQGGGIQANLDRWKGQFKNQLDAKTGKRTMHGLPVTTIDVTGDYSGMGSGAAKSGYRMLGAIVEGPGGNVFFKFTGPAKTIAANQPKFELLLGSVSK